MEDGRPVPGSLYIYAPNKIAPVIFAVLFGASTICHAYQIHIYRCFKLMWIFPVCCLLFTVGFAMREFGAFDYGNLGGFIVSQMFIYFSPPMLELANYHILGRILYYVPYNSPLHPGRVLTTFGMLSTVVEVFNAIGVSYGTNPALPERYISLGNALMKASLALQLIVISLFYVLASLFHVRCAQGGVLIRSVRAPLITLYTSSCLLLIRTIYRTVEYVGTTNLSTGAGFDFTSLSPILRYEWFFYVFEASIMLVNVVLWSVRHPRRYLPEDYRVYLAKDGVTEVQGPGWDDKRGFLVTLMDPFGILTCMEPRDKKPFWEADVTPEGGPIIGRESKSTVSTAV